MQRIHTPHISTHMLKPKKVVALDRIFSPFPVGLSVDPVRVNLGSERKNTETNINFHGDQ